MANVNIEELLYKINNKLKENNKKIFFDLIKKNEMVKNMDLHRVEIIGKKINNAHFSQSSFRGSFIVDSVFFNCYFYNCSFLTSVIYKSEFINCKFQECIFYAASVDNNVEENCLFINCYTEYGNWDKLDNLLWRYEHGI